MEKKFEIVNNYTAAMFTDFANFHCKYVQGIAYLRYLGWCILVVAIYQLVTTAGFKLQDLVLSPVVLLSLAFIIMSYQILNITARRLYKNAQKTANLAVKLTFYVEYVTIQSSTGSINFHYSELRKSYETKQYFYLYTQRGVAQIIDKASFTIGEPAALSEFLLQETSLKLVKKLQFK